MRRRFEKRVYIALPEASARATMFKVIIFIIVIIIIVVVVVVVVIVEVKLG